MRICIPYQRRWIVFDDEYLESIYEETGFSEEQLIMLCRVMCCKYYCDIHYSDLVEMPCPKNMRAVFEKMTDSIDLHDTLCEIITNNDRDIVVFEEMDGKEYDESIGYFHRIYRVLFQRHYVKTGLVKINRNPTMAIKIKVLAIHLHYIKINSTAEQVLHEFCEKSLISEENAYFEFEGKPLKPHHILYVCGVSAFSRVSLCYYKKNLDCEEEKQKVFDVKKYYRERFFVKI